MKWYKKMLQMIHKDFFANYVDFLKKETNQGDLELFWQELYKISSFWQEKYYITSSKYDLLYGVYGFTMIWFMDEFIFEDSNNLTEKYIYILFFLSSLEGKSIADKISLLKEENTNHDWTNIYNSYVNLKFSSLISNHFMLK